MKTKEAKGQEHERVIPRDGGDKITPLSTAHTGKYKYLFSSAAIAVLGTASLGCHEPARLFFAEGGAGGAEDSGKGGSEIETNTSDTTNGGNQTTISMESGGTGGSQTTTDTLSITTMNPICPLEGVNCQTEVCDPVGIRCDEDKATRKKVCRFHDGNDYFADFGTPLYAPLDGTVDAIVKDPESDHDEWFVRIQHDEQVYSTYSHLSNIFRDEDETLLKVGYVLQQGDRFGAVGYNNIPGFTHAHIEQRYGSGKGGEIQSPFTSVLPYVNDVTIKYKVTIHSIELIEGARYYVKFSIVVPRKDLALTGWTLDSFKPGEKLDDPSDDTPIDNKEYDISKVRAAAGKNIDKITTPEFPEVSANIYNCGDSEYKLFATGVMPEGSSGNPRAFKVVARGPKGVVKGEDYRLVY